MARFVIRIWDGVEGVWDKDGWERMGLCLGWVLVYRRQTGWDRTLVSYNIQALIPLRHLRYIYPRATVLSSSRACYLLVSIG